MRQAMVTVTAVLLALSVLIAGCASDRGFRCGGDLVPINAPRKTARAPILKRTEQPRHAAGEAL